MRVVSVVGARPQFIKLAPVHLALTRQGVEHIIIHTGQHYDEKLSGIFFKEFNIPQPNTNLDIGSHSHAIQTAKMIEGLEPRINDAKPDWVVAYGDTNSTLACAIVCSKLPYRLAHIEAGLRSRNRLMPEELNRIITDHASDILLAPTETAMQHLKREGLQAKSHLVGDVMIDILNKVRDSVEGESELISSNLGLKGEFNLATIHRQENTDNESRLREIIKNLADLELPTYIPSHPRLVNRCEQFDIALDNGNLSPINPLSYRELVASVIQSQHVITDSGGLQKETFHLETPCTTVRPETEWPETLIGEWNTLTEPNNIQLSVNRTKPTQKRGSPYGGGDASELITNKLLSE
jgi:UDP-N-acetylglucosamine 2-epimerase (non-hydrolysing)